ncbi:MAG: hypothetical protein K6B13_03425 [Prevotella sp.]|nr:hypothetical protein [Prevotella sp.]
MSLPEAFVKTTVDLMGEERFSRYLASFGEEVPVSIRINPKRMEGERWSVEGGEPVPWCRHAYYLSERPNFTFDPLLHAGCYYVQEAASMFLDEVLRQHLPALTQQPSTLISQLSSLISQPSSLRSTSGRSQGENSQLSTQHALRRPRGQRRLPPRPAAYAAAPAEALMAHGMAHR